MFESLLINFLFLLIPVLAYLIFFENRIRFFNTPILIALSALSMILCMTYPIHLNSGFIFDLRFIVFIIVALFGGYKYAFPLYIILNLYRFIIGGDGTIQSFLFSTTVLVIVSSFSKKFIRLQPRYRIFYAVLSALATMIVYLTSLGLQIPLNREFWTLSFHAIATHILLMTILMFLIEQVIANMKARETFLQSERLHLISELSASVAHEIRNPLTVTNGFLQLLRDSESIPSKEKEYINYSLQELHRAEKIVSDFLVYSKPQSHNMIISNFKKEMEYAKNILSPYANMHQVDIQLNFRNSLTVEYDQNQMQQCLINLYKNGIESMEKSGGTLLVDVREQKNRIIIQVKDSGIGMTKEEVSRLGKPYYSTKKQGTGLGMLMVYSTIHKIKGHIRVESEKGKGTTFTITIPV